MKVTEINRIVRGKLIGDGQLTVQHIAPPGEASPEDLTFYFGEKEILKTEAGCVITRRRLKNIKNQIIVADPRLALYHLLKKIENSTRKKVKGERIKDFKNSKISPFAIIEPDVKIGKNVTIGPFSYIGRSVKIGDDVFIGARATILDKVIIGNRVFIQPGAVIGSEGFGYVKKGRRYLRISHIGGVIIDDDVEIGANVTIDRGTIGDTIIGAGTKIDNLVHIGHNVKIGKNCIIIAQVGISGSVRIGDNVILAGQVGIKDNVEIGDNSIIYAKSAVFKSVPKNSIWSGIPARNHYETMKAYARLFSKSKNNKREDNPERHRTFRQKDRS